MQNKVKLHAVLAFHFIQYVNSKRANFLLSIKLRFDPFYKNESFREYFSQPTEELRVSDLKFLYVIVTSRNKIMYPGNIFLTSLKN